MPVIRVENFIQAPLDLVFDLSRDIGLHQQSAAGTNETAIAGKTAGLIALGETVTWRAKHFGIYQTLKVQITEMERPIMFTDVMLDGPFKSMSHQHLFVAVEGGTRMIDVFSFEAPLGWLGRLAETLFLRRYMKAFLMRRNKFLKIVAESTTSSVDSHD